MKKCYEINNKCLKQFNQIIITELCYMITLQHEVKSVVHLYTARQRLWYTSTTRGKYCGTVLQHDIKIVVHFYNTR